MGLGTLQQNYVINYCMNNDKAALGGTLQEVQKSDQFSCTPHGKPHRKAIGGFSIV